MAQNVYKVSGAGENIEGLDIESLDLQALNIVNIEKDIMKKFTYYLVRN